MRRYILGVLAAGLVVVLAIRLAGGQSITWLHPFTFWACFTVGLPAAALHAVWSRQELRRALRHALHPGADPGGAPASGFIWRAAEGIALLSGCLGSITGLMITFSVLERGAVGLKVAASLTPLFFGLVSALAFRLLRLRAEQPLADRPLR